MEDGSLWWVVKRGEIRVVEVSAWSIVVLVMSSLAQLLVLLCGDVYLYPSHGKLEGYKISVYRRYGEQNSYI